ncbi:hypothetical protein QE152_g12495 [Popillia japonica]|uniref:Uncharacterized protein n=1 Tax=Popillia japonica TaxID=7064 RepID=A0AAW1LQW7_POPJA
MRYEVPRRSKEDYKNRPPSNLRLNLVVMKCGSRCNVIEEAGPVLGTHLMTPPMLQSIGLGVGTPLGMKHYCELQEPINILPLMLRLKRVNSKPIKITATLCGERSK